jgi:predicted transcriptional regulator
MLSASSTPISIDLAEHARRWLASRSGGVIEGGRAACRGEEGPLSTTGPLGFDRRESFRHGRSFYVGSRLFGEPQEEIAVNEARLDHVGLTAANVGLLCVVPDGLEETMAATGLVTLHEALVDKRRESIVDLLQKEGKIRVEHLADRLKVSQVTIRKDLDILEKRGLLERSHGNAMFSQQSRFNIAFLEKLQMQAPAKELIAQAAASCILEGDSIILDSGTTTLSLAQALVGKFQSLFVITNSVPIALELSKSGYELLLVGGQVRNHSLALIGPMGVKNLESLGLSKQDILHNWQTNPLMRSAAGQQVLYEWASMKSQKAEAAKWSEKAARTVPPVQRPGVSRPAGEVASENVQALDRALSKSGSLKDAERLLFAKLGKR